MTRLVASAAIAAAVIAAPVIAAPVIACAIDIGASAAICPASARAPHGAQHHRGQQGDQQYYSKFTHASAP